ncbi:2147_t:CDS:2 [Acaulospora colombiana]|uniref:2147_t:CDS:1 n=1 Tax=Acaulospora colombiana TaxID=27376 RepID=A0ACA9K9A9_9GLOM|nr:2147_t:CDS:2 [Acaulospora colombiana]
MAYFHDTNSPLQMEEGNSQNHDPKERSINVNIQPAYFSSPSASSSSSKLQQNFRNSPSPKPLQSTHEQSDSPSIESRSSCAQDDPSLPRERFSRLDQQNFSNSHVPPSRSKTPIQKPLQYLSSPAMPNVPQVIHSNNRYDYYDDSRDSIISHLSNPRMSIRRDSLEEQDYFPIHSFIRYYEDSETEDDTERSNVESSQSFPVYSNNYGFSNRPPSSFYPDDVINEYDRKGKGRDGSRVNHDSFVYNIGLDHESRYNVLSRDSFQNSSVKKNSSTYTASEFSHDGENYNLGYPHTTDDGVAYASWNSDDHQAPVSKEEIEDIFTELVDKFGFQKQSMRNIFDLLMCMLDSRASRMTPTQALLTVHADYIGGKHANYYQWYFATRMDLDDDDDGKNSVSDLPSQENKDSEEEWNRQMRQMSHQDRVRHIALWLLLWGEAAQVRFTSECLCFIFKLADDYTKGPEYKAVTQPVPEGEYLRNVVTPLYQYILDQGYKMVDGSFVKREKDHAETIGYDDINELFWYAESIERIVLKDKSSLMALHKSQRYQMLGQVDWNHVFKKTYKEKRTWLHLAVNFTRVWILHVSIFWYYTSFNASFLYTDINNPEPAVQFSVVALGGAISTLFMIVGCVCEFFFIPLKKDNLSLLAKRLAILFLILIVNSAPTYYIYVKARTSQISLVIGVVQFIISLFITLIFVITPSAKLFGGLLKGSQKYRAFKTFTANYPTLSNRDRATSVGLWLCVFGCKFVESYFFLSLSFKDPLKAMADSRSINCGNAFMSRMICSSIPLISMVFMIIVDLILFFLDTYLWYVIWYTIFSVVRSFYLGISIWTPWKNIYSMLPKRIYAKILAASNIEIRPKILVSQIWNAIVISMYRDHFLSIENVQKLLYRKHFLPIENVQKLLYQQVCFFYFYNAIF